MLDEWSKKRQPEEVAINVLRVAAVSILVAMGAVGCSEADQRTEVRAVVAPHFAHEGRYDVQVSRDGADPFCFWGETVFAVAFPAEPLTLEVSYVCTGQ